VRSGKLEGENKNGQTQIVTKEGEEEILHIN